MPVAAPNPADLDSSAPVSIPRDPEGAVPFWRCGVLLLLTLVMLLSSWLRPSVNLPPQSGVVMNLPDVVKLQLPNRPDVQFYGSKAPISEGELGILPSDTQFVRKQYDDFRGHESILCTVLLSGVEQRSIHRAEVCLPAQGWNIVGQGDVPVPLASGHNLMVRNLAIERDAVTPDNQHHTIQAYFMYWFVGDNLTTPSQFMRIFMNSWDRILYSHAYRWAYIMAMAPITSSMRPDGLDAPQTQAMLTQFIGQAVPTFQKSEMPDSETR